MSSSKGKRRHFVSLPSQDNIVVAEHPGVGEPSSTPRDDDQHGPSSGTPPAKPGDASQDLNSAGEHSRLHRGLSTRQVQMIAVAGKGTLPMLSKVV